MVWQVGGPKGHGAELMINIALASMHVILYIDILGPTIVMSGGAMAPLAPPCSAAYAILYATTVTMYTPVDFYIHRHSMHPMRANAWMSNVIM